ncbi:MAG: DNA-formamidopyrimidine glycosylase [Candidatus Nealsonbacteria bacterium RBG_13_42_11]|uniref:DNA-formamidopyrimidine glycosylase n=1 Tax=Candidatus Nealsonbacteria bacterium RBG_13_42_11 TaxID=1801663 RepID=A0A1G2DZT5_9BACT|nr:MAG: DNA-formamidopyrimidine glycosylase [Candidatus Nealsonbacteria bacterium RBG_13_42_11]
MPELPEVETIRHQLAKKLIGKKLNGQPITKIRRRAKLLIIDFKDGSSLVFHLKLTGQLIFNGKPSSYTRKVFYFDDGARLVFNDARKFGWWKKVKDTKKTESQFGPEALEVDFPTLKDGLKKHPRAEIKRLLMDQKFIAGIGNIYSDEILFAAKVHPFRKINTLNDQEIRQIHQNIKRILKDAIQYHGTTARDYSDAYGNQGNYASRLKVYGQEGKKCPRCGTIIKRIKRGRSSHFCPKCQIL